VIVLPLPPLLVIVLPLPPLLLLCCRHALCLPSKD
jgi:hypothetical protein